jgi:dephospho-CoA kinase
MPDSFPFQVGLTGGIGSGKSLVARIFSRLGVPVYESDTEAKKLYLDPEVKAQVVELFGKDAYLETGQPNTGFLASRIYAQPALRTSLNGIMHPAVGRHYKEWLNSVDSPYVLKVAALLFEAGIYKELDMTLLVISPASLRESRVQKRDPFRPGEQIRQIMQAQWTEEQKIPLAQGVLHNDENQSLILQVLDWDARIRHRILTPSL